jgi:wyosine [tRNA(Phe)-imidazoG37] synthetase (radical SAM superfamily)
MVKKSYQYLYGPVPSRRLGRSLGVDLVPFKTCTYDCIYCQLGRTTNKTIQRRDYVPIHDVMAELENKLKSPFACDYISLAGSGEPTLHSGIGDLIEKIKTVTHLPVAVITNGSLLYLPEVREALMAADVVLPSLDVGDEQLFQYVNRPHSAISFERMVQGLMDFSKYYTGQIWLEVLLLGGVTGIQSEAEKIASIAGLIHPTRIQLNTVHRPPAEETAFGLTAEQLISLKRLFPGEVDIISALHQKEETSIGKTDAATDDDIVALLARRPCTIVDMACGLNMHVNEVIKRMEKLIEAGRVNCVVTRKRNYYTKRS